jgi:hypothetical protein
MATSQGPTIAYALSLAGGVIILLVSAVGLAWFALGGPYWGGYGGWMGGMMGYHGFFGGYAGSYGFFGVLSAVGLISGIIIVTGAVMLRARPQEHTAWGVVILVFSIVSFVGMGGYFVGALLGIAGGAFALSYHPRTERVQSPTQ